MPRPGPARCLSLAALPCRFPDPGILSCRWPRVRRAVASPPETEVLFGGHSFTDACSPRRLRHRRAAISLGVERSSHEVLPPTARQTSRSDRHPASLFPLMPVTRRACLTRLRYAFRFSQPLDVLFLSKPFQPCFVLVALMGFRLRSVPLPSSCAAVSRPLDLSSSASPSAGSPSVLPPPVPVQGFGHLVSPLPRPVLPGTRDSLLPWRLSPRGLFPSAWALASEHRR